MLSFFRQKRTYLDFAAATPVADEVRAAMREAEEVFANPSAIHLDGVAAKDALERSRERIARGLQCRTKEIIFTSGGTEGSNIAILGSIQDPSGVHIVVSAIEHPSVLEPISALEKRGANVTRVAPDKHGQIRPEAIAAALTPHTRLVSVGWANSEIGVVQPLSAIAKVIRDHEAKHGSNILFHSDAGQAPLYLKNVVNTLGVDMMTFDAGKLYGPRGAGVLFVRHGVELHPVIFGGGQERGLRPGTENVTLAAGCAAAFELAAERRDEDAKRLAALRDGFARDVEERIPGTVWNGRRAKHLLPHIANISIPGIDAEYVALALDHKGVAVSTKTSCEEGERESSVVAALAHEPSERWQAASALRISLGRTTTAGELGRAADALASVVVLAQKIDNRQGRI